MGNGEAVVMESLKKISDSLETLVSHNQTMSERMATQEATTGHLTKSIDKLALVSQDVVKAVGALTIENQNLEKQVIKSIEDVKVLQEKQGGDIEELAKRVTAIEIARAEDRGEKKIENKVSDRVWSQWFNVGKFLGAIVTVLAAIFAGTQIK